MSRRGITQIFPFLLPLRKWQRKKLFYLKMRFDGNSYARETSDISLPNTVYETASLMLNENSGFDIKYQLNKAHNLKIAAKPLNGVVIKPQETFSFWQLVRQADRHERYRDGLELVRGKIVASYGGGLCQLSNMLFLLFLHTPLTVVERHGHAVEAFLPANEGMLHGIDATISEGWLDLKVRNDTDNVFQIEVSFDDRFMYGRILSLYPVEMEYTVFNPAVSYVRQGGKVYQICSVCRTERDRASGEQYERELYINRCEIAYELPHGTLIEERGL